MTWTNHKCRNHAQNLQHLPWENDGILFSTVCNLCSRRRFWGLSDLAHQCCVQIHVVSTVWLTCECNEPACSASCGLSPNPLHCSSRVVWLESKEQEMSQCGSYVNAMSLLTTPAVAFYRPCCSHYGECSIFSMTFGGGCSPFLALKSPHSRHWVD